LKVTKFHFGIKDRRVGIQTFRKGLVAFAFNGDSMTGDDIRHGDTGTFELTDLENVRIGKPVLVEKVGDEEGSGAWALKRNVIPRPRSYAQNQWGESIDWNDPIIELQSSNPCIHPCRLDPHQEYRVRGYFARFLRPEEVESIVLPDGIDGWPRASKPTFSGLRVGDCSSPFTLAAGSAVLHRLDPRTHGPRSITSKILPNR
jgi:hypothetical protein